MALRRNTGYADGMWNLSSGKLDAGEHVLAAATREAREELGIDLDQAALELAGVLHHRGPEQVGRVGMVFRALYDPARHGLPINAEPHKCGGIDWFPSDALPEATVPTPPPAWTSCGAVPCWVCMAGMSAPPEAFRPGMGASASA